MKLKNWQPFLVTFLAIVECGLGCKSQPAATTTTTTPIPSNPTTRTNLVISHKTGTAFAFARLPESDNELEPFEPAQPGLGAPSPDNFRGTDRRAAKTSYVENQQPTAFANMTALFASGLFLPDQEMVNHNPPISKDATSDRLPEEQHVVTVMGYLYASSKESDNDFHCIVGNAPGEPQQFLNVEVSGLPTSGPFRAQLKTVRDTFKGFFGQNLPAQSYSKFDPPIPVRITGSIFFDIDHPAGAVGPTGLKPTTAWEIHPVTDIVFEP